VFYSYPTALPYSGPSFFRGCLLKLATVSVVPLVELAFRTDTKETAILSCMNLFFSGFGTLTQARDRRMLA